MKALIYRLFLKASKDSCLVQILNVNGIKTKRNTVVMTTMKLGSSNPAWEFTKQMGGIRRPYYFTTVPLYYTHLCYWVSYELLFVVDLKAQMLQRGRLRKKRTWGSYMRDTKVLMVRLRSVSSDCHELNSFLKSFSWAFVFLVYLKVQLSLISVIPVLSQLRGLARETP